jgi:hypothetical protein
MIFIAFLAFLVSVRAATGAEGTLIWIRIFVVPLDDPLDVVEYLREGAGVRQVESVRRRRSVRADIGVDREFPLQALGVRHAAPGAPSEYGNRRSG